MKKQLPLYITLLVFLLSSYFELAAQKKHKALFVIADGIPADLIESLDMPALKEISKQGGYARAHVGGERTGYSETPTISAVGYNSLLTGTWVNKHNVWGNEIEAPNYNYWNIYRLFKAQYPQKKTAIYSTWIDNRTKLIGSDAAAAGNIQPDIIFDGMELDTVNFPHDDFGYFYNVIDDSVINRASASIKKDAPDLSWVYLEYTDEMGHRHGNGDTLTNAVKLLDDKLKRLWDAIVYRQKNFDEEWQLYITTDHGRENNGYHHGGQGERERTTWIATNAGNLNQYFFKGNPGIIDIMPSIAKHLGVKIPREKLMEVDGISLTGEVSATDADVQRNGNKLYITWKPVDKTGMTKIWVTTTNNFKKGGEDAYKLVTVVPVSDGKTMIDVKNMPSDFYKVVIELPYNFLNRWIIPEAP
ncbi:MAG: alkaline phosphatase family protein [Chitinophagaceae bacterium]|nr:alkaline phosphatase family protein [Chitinophagaceae bacterium]